MFHTVHGPKSIDFWLIRLDFLSILTFVRSNLCPRPKVTVQFQQFYDIQPNLKTAREDLIKFLKSDEDEAPFNLFQSKKLPAYMAREMEGKLNDVELKKALFEKMHGNSAPGLDGFTVNWLRTFWPE